MNEQRIREAILDVIDDGDTVTALRPAPWVLYHWNEGVANTQRLDFVDAVIAKLKPKPTLSPEDAAKLESKTIGEHFNHSHYEDVLRVQRQTS